MRSSDLALPAIGKDRNDQRTVRDPVLDTLAAMTAESVARCNLDPNSLLAVRVAALAAADAPAASYLLHVGPAMDVGLTVDQVQNILIGIAPIVGISLTPWIVLQMLFLGFLMSVAVTSLGVIVASRMASMQT